jgi:hypothetical protein
MESPILCWKSFIAIFLQETSDVQNNDFGNWCRDAAVKITNLCRFPYSDSAGCSMRRPEYFKSGMNASRLVCFQLEVMKMANGQSFNLFNLFESG